MFEIMTFKNYERSLKIVSFYVGKKANLIVSKLEFLLFIYPLPTSWRLPAVYVVELVHLNINEHTKSKVLFLHI